MKLHTVIISWQGQEENAKHIADCVAGHTDFLSVIYSNAENQDQTGSGNWHKVPNDWFYGKKFHQALQLNQGDIHLQIQADARSNDWPNVLRHCKQTFISTPNVGVWTTETDHTPWPTKRVSICPYPHNPDLLLVTQTDGIVWALSRQLIQWLAKMDYDSNNLGWGMDWAAAAHAYSNNLLVVRDTRVLINHPVGRGYGKEEARKQMDLFLLQLTPTEVSVKKLLECWIESTRSREKNSRGIKSWFKRKGSSKDITLIAKKPGL